MRLGRSVRAALLACALLTLAPAAASAASRVRIVVGARSLPAVAGARAVKGIRLPGMRVITVPAARAAETLRTLRADPGVRFAVRDVVAHAVAADPLLKNQYGLNNAGGVFDPEAGFVGTPDADIDAPEAWRTDVGSGVPVAVVDSRVYGAHPDLSGSVIPGHDFGDPGEDPTGEGFAHGTHVAGIIAAHQGNGVGGSGVAPGVKIVAYRVLNDAGEGFVSQIAEGMAAAGAAHIRVVNLSLSASGGAATFAPVIDAYPNTLFVAAAGNAGVNVDTTPQFPCDMPEPNVICVGATNWHDQRAPFSDYGAANVNVYAPGADVLSTVPPTWNPPTAHRDYTTTPYEWFDGTSMATPMVSGIAALALAKEPSLSAAELRQIIINAADPRAGLPSVSGGRANAAQTIARTADRDQDGKLNSLDACPDAAGATPSGCPDTDADGRTDNIDACPTVPAATRNGCPLSRVRSLRVRIRRRHGRVALRIRVLPTSAGRAVLRLERRACRHHRCHYRRVVLKRFSVPARGRTITVRGRHGHSLAAGRYKVLVRLSSGAGTGPQRTRRFRVR